MRCHSLPLSVSFAPRIHGSLPFSEGKFSRLGAFQRIEKADIEHWGNDRVEHVGLPLDHQVLPGAEVWEPLFHEVLHPFQGFLPCHGKGEVRGFVGCIRKTDFQVGRDLPGDGVLFRSWKCPWAW